MFFQTLDLDPKGQPFLVSCRGNISLVIPEGWWVAIVTSAVSPSRFLTEAKFYGVKAEEVTLGVLDIRGDNSPDWEGYIRWWKYVVAAPRQFVFVVTGDSYADVFSIARVVQDGQVASDAPDLVPTAYERGAKGWRWVELQKLLAGLGRSFEDLPEELWALVGEQISTLDYCQEDYDDVFSVDDDGESFYRNRRPISYRIRVTVGDPKSKVIQAQCPIDDSPCSMYDSPLERLPIDKLWIPAGLAKDIMYILTFVLK